MFVLDISSAIESVTANQMESTISTETSSSIASSATGDNPICDKNK